MLVKTKTLTKPYILSKRLVLEDGARAFIHIARYDRRHTHPKVVLFKKATPLLDYCHKNEISHAVTGGFFVRSKSKPLGETWINGKEVSTIPFVSPWHEHRGSLHINQNGHLEIGPRDFLPTQPGQDLLQAGPLLIYKGESLIKEGVDPDGFSAGAHQFDDDITIGRFPRTAIAANDNYIWLLASDGYTHPSRSVQNAGLSLQELADILLELGANQALNLDGGSSSSLVFKGQLVNKARGGRNDKYREFPEGRAIYSAIVLRNK